MKDTCRWCKHYKNGKCLNDNFYSESEHNIYSVSESGQLSGVIEEVLEDSKAKRIINAIDAELESYKVSKVRRKEIKDIFNEMLQDYFVDLRDELDSEINRLYVKNAEDNTIDAVIISPNEFCCNKFE